MLCILDAKVIVIFMKTVCFNDSLEVRYFQDTDSSSPPSNLSSLSLITVQNITESSPDLHFYIHIIEKPVQSPSELAAHICSIFPDLSNLKSLYILPESYSSAISIGVELNSTELLARYVLNTSWVTSVGSFYFTPGKLATHYWPSSSTKLLQGFFYLSNDPIDSRSENLCYIVSLPPNTKDDEILTELSKHKISPPIDIVFNPWEEEHIRRLEFDRSSIKHTLYSLCMRFRYYKPVIILPCGTRTPVEYLYEQLQVKVSNLTYSIKPKYLLSRLEGRFGPVVELIYTEKDWAVVVFQLKRSADRAVEKGEYVLKGCYLKISRVDRPYRMTGNLITTYGYNDELTKRPLPLVPNSNV